MCITIFRRCMVSLIRGRGGVGSAGRSTSMRIAFQALWRKYFVQIFVQLIHRLSFPSFRAFPLIGYIQSPEPLAPLGQSPSIAIPPRFCNFWLFTKMWLHVLYSPWHPPRLMPSRPNIKRQGNQKSRGTLVKTAAQNGQIPAIHETPRESTRNPNKTTTTPPRRYECGLILAP